MILIPLRTDTQIRRTPTANYLLIAANVLIFLLTYDFHPRREIMPGLYAARSSPLRESLAHYHLMLEAANPSLYQLFTYQFLHDGWQHLLGNMLFLWVFGNSVNAKMGQLTYLLFYLSCGVAAGTAYLAINDATMLGASGAIAGVTTAFLVLFPRSRTSFFYWFFVIGYFELPSMILIVAKIIVYDNLIEPLLSGGGSIAYSAHVAGYLAGASIALFLLLVRAIPRDQFDLLALWKRAYRRRAFAQAVAADPLAPARAMYGRMVRTDPDSAGPNLDKGTAIRGEITAAYRSGDMETAADGYMRLTQVDPDLVLPRQQQLDVANTLMKRQKHAESARAYEKYLAHYPTGEHAQEIRLMLGVIYAKYLAEYEQAKTHLLRCREGLSDSRLLDQCNEWLNYATSAADPSSEPGPQPP
jgi:membrane associated rhomboid family serine protease